MDDIKKEKTIKSLDRTFKQVANIFPENLKKGFLECCFFAGGCIYSKYNGKRPNDYDIFCTSQALALALKDYLYTSNNYTFISQHAITFKIKSKKFQIVTKWFGEIEDVIGQFDFKHNMFGYKNGNIYCGADDGYLDSKFLRFNFKRARDIASSITRVPKFVARGFICTRREIARMLGKLADTGMPQSEIDSIEEIIGGHGY